MRLQLLEHPDGVVLVISECGDELPLFTNLVDTPPRWTVGVLVLSGPVDIGPVGEDA